jgi:hypothetical protein
MRVGCVSASRIDRSRDLPVFVDPCNTTELILGKAVEWMRRNLEKKSGMSMLLVEKRFSSQRTFFVSTSSGMKDEARRSR